MSFLFFSKGCRFVVLKGKKEGTSYSLAFIFFGGLKKHDKDKDRNKSWLFFSHRQFLFSPVGGFDEWYGAIPVPKQEANLQEESTRCTENRLGDWIETIQKVI